MTQKVDPKVWFGLHFAEGVAQYDRGNGVKEMLFISDEVAKKMNETFAGKPVYINHPEKLDLALDAIDGVVVESFFNKLDGKHWAKFVTLTERANAAIAQGYKLSNCYNHTTDNGTPGEWHGVPFDKEVTNAEYEHLAIVQNPKYEESIILTQEEFDEYNSKKESELGNRYVNEKTQKGESEMFSLFKKEKVENSDSLKGLSVVLPKSKVEVTVEKALNMADEEMVKKSQNPDMFCTGEESVKVGEKTMKVAELVKEYQNLADYKHKNESAKVDEEIEEELEEEENEEKEEKEEKKEEKKEENSNFHRLANAASKAKAPKPIVVEVGSDRVKKGLERYGSKK